MPDPPTDKQAEMREFLLDMFCKNTCTAKKIFVFEFSIQRMCCENATSMCDRIVHEELAEAFKLFISDMSIELMHCLCETIVNDNTPKFQVMLTVEQVQKMSDRLNRSIRHHVRRRHPEQSGD